MYTYYVYKMEQNESNQLLYPGGIQEGSGALLVRFHKDARTLANESLQPDFLVRKSMLQFGAWLPTEFLTGWEVI